MTQLDLRELREFGAEADRLEQPSIGMGGFVIPRRESTPFQLSGEEDWIYEGLSGTRAEETGPATGPRQRPSAEAAASSSPAYALGHRVSEVLKLGELLDYHPDTAVVGGSPGFVLLSVPVGLFHTLPYRAHLVLEVPSGNPPSLANAYRGGFVPDVRVWAVWNHGVLIQSHHKYPDRSICAAMPGQWVWGRDPLHVYAEWCMCWIAKTLYMQCFDTWPGLQHAGADVRLRRNKPEEYCGCGHTKLRYRACCMQRDAVRSAYELYRKAVRERQLYLDELRASGRVATPPFAWAVDANASVSLRNRTKLTSSR
jgi:hypothetical protein